MNDIERMYEYRKGSGADKVWVKFGEYGTGNQGEMEMEWDWWMSGEIKGARLIVFDDAWKALASFRGLLDDMALVNNKSITPEQFMEILEKHGFKRSGWDE